MAFMRSETTKKHYLTGEFTSRSALSQSEATNVAAVLGFGSATASSEAIKGELARVAQNRAELVKEIADTVLAGVVAGITVTPEIDVQAIASAVEAQLADEFAGVPAEVVGELTARLTS
jgi:hypothetical protein